MLHHHPIDVVYKQHYMVSLRSTLSMNKRFPSKLYAMLECVSESEHSSAIHWTHNGLAFVIIQQDVFLEHVAPVFFNQTKFLSFVSQLISYPRQ